MKTVSIQLLLEPALSARKFLHNKQHISAFRLFNGFIEGDSSIVVDLYAKTLVIHNYHRIPVENSNKIKNIVLFYRENLSFIKSIVLKTRYSKDSRERTGVLIYGEHADTKIEEYQTKYSIDIMLNRDAGLYLDTRLLREWIIKNMNNKSVLNTFAYTGSLGVAAQKAGAQDVVHTDLNKKNLNIAKQSYSLNGFPIKKGNFITGDFFPVVKQLIRQNRRFDAVFLDPPFFAAGKKGSVDLQHKSHDLNRLINKIRPLVNDGGKIVAINNSIFTTGKMFIDSLQELCRDGFVEIEQMLNVGSDFTGFIETIKSQQPVSSAPFNHSTKITVLKIKHK